MRTSTACLSLLICLRLAPGVLRAEAWTLDEALQAALRGNPDARLAHAARRSL